MLFALYSWASDFRYMLESAGWLPFRCNHGPWAPQLRPVACLRHMESTPMQAALLLGSIYIRKIAYAASVVADALSRLSGTWRQRASLNSDDLCKRVLPLRVSDCRPAGSQAQFLSTFPSRRVAWQLVWLKCSQLQISPSPRWRPTRSAVLAGFRPQRPHPWLPASSHDKSRAHLRASWRPAEAASGPICRPLPGGGQGGKNLHHPGGPKARQEIVSIDRPRPTPVSARFLLQRPPLAAILPISRPLPQYSL